VTVCKKEGTMRRVLVRRPSPALVVACLALLVALGGTGYATVLNVPRNSVGTVNLKNNAVTGPKVRNASLTRADFRAGQLPAGPVGPQGPAGPAGPAGAPGLSAVERIDTTSVSNSTSPKTASLTCPAGKRLIGGGGRVNATSPNVAIVAAFPDNDNVYRATAREVVATGTAWTVTAFAVCANAT
jgi:hypothetical protein